VPGTVGAFARYFLDYSEADVFEEALEEGGDAVEERAEVVGDVMARVE